MDTFEKKYNEAMLRADEAVQKGCLGKDMFDIIFPPEESEDERIRKWLYGYFSKIGGKNWIHPGITCEEVLAWLEKQKEQKPETLTDGTKEYTIREDYTSAYYEERGYARGYNDGIRDSKLVSSKPPQKPAEKQDYSGLNDLERAIHRGFLCAGVENVPVTTIKETAQECMAKIKPAEWSEEDEKMLARIIERGQSQIQMFETGLLPEHISWLKSLRPSWKPSEEQMAWLKLAIDEAKEPLKSQLEELYKNIRENLIWK